MKYSVSSKIDRKKMEDADEIRCAFNRLGDIYSFIKDNPNKRYVIEMGDFSVIDKEIFDKLIEQTKYLEAIPNKDYVIQCKNFNELHLLIDSGFKAYFKYAATDWETFDNLLKLGVSDILIDGPLGFNVTKLKKAKSYFDVNIRAIPHASSNALYNNSELTNTNTFFIRPEDTDYYEDAIDVFEFNAAPDTEETLFDIYKRKSYNFNLRLLIKQLNINVENLFIRKDFAERRINCGQKCKSFQRRNSCNYCETMLKLTNNLAAAFKSK